METVQFHVKKGRGSTILCIEIADFVEMETTALVGALYQELSRIKEQWQDESTFREIEHYPALITNPSGVTSPTGNIPNKYEKIAIPTTDGTLFIQVQDILFIKADTSYSVVHVQNHHPIMVSRRLKVFSELLEGKGFVRAHKSHLINIWHVQEMNRSDGQYLVMKDGTRLNISRANRGAVAAALSGFIRTI